jgi:Tol biopolymer transport system component
MKFNSRLALTLLARLRPARPSLKGQAPTLLIALVACALLSAPALAPRAQAQSDKKKDDKKEDKKPKEVLKIQRLTQGMGLYAIGPVSPDRQSVLLLAQKPDQAPNLYLMNLADHAIRPALTSFKWGASDPQWSPDGNSVALAGLDDNGSFTEVYVLDLKTGRLRQMTKNAFSDREPVFSPDGKRVIYTTDESPLPDAAFGVLHVAAVPAGGGKPEYFTEDETSSIHPGISADAKSVLLVKVGESSGRHSLWQYGLDGKPQRDLTEDKFARIHRYIQNPANGTVALWAQEAAEQQEDVYILDMKTGKVTDLPDPDQPKLTPALSPGGQLIAFVGPTDTGSQLFVYDSASRQIQQLTYKPATTRTPVFVSDHEILFGSDRDKQNEIYLIDLTPPTEKKK